MQRDELFTHASVREACYAAQERLSHYDDGYVAALKSLTYDERIKVPALAAIRDALYCHMAACGLTPQPARRWCAKCIHLRMFGLERNPPVVEVDVMVCTQSFCIGRNDLEEAGHVTH